MTGPALSTKMTKSFDVSLLRRQLGEKRRHTSIKTLYGDRTWVDDLDIVNELGGHTGCVNALSWSKSGRLLASGSDDTYLNIWSHNPDSQARPFSLATSVSTGHTQNIFSVKFMPHSNDRTVVTAAGDAQVRIFDIEQESGSGNVSADSGFSDSTRSRRFNTFFPNARFLNEGNTNARVYRSHADRVKRIVTESSPHLFLTCSEDGEVRQWDLRQPSSAYPSPRGGTGYMRYGSNDEHDADNVPPPLISYKKYALDLNSISCSGSQPQYIALGGAHLHCFLHDRRMLGRDLAVERGLPNGSTPVSGSHGDEEMSAATRCVRRFAPNEKRKMGAHDNGHITACKISDANPNEMIASWSGDHIYSFDLVRSPDARQREASKAMEWEANQSKLRDQRDRKRKRTKAAPSSTSLAGKTAPRRRLRRVADDQQEQGNSALRVRYGNGQIEDIPLEMTEENGATNMETARDALLTEAQKLSDRVAKALVQLRKTMFDFSASATDAMAMETSSELTPHTSTFTSVLGQAATLLTQMDNIIRDWTYPMDPSPEDVTMQQTLRRNRQASWRFVQSNGTLARTLGGRLQTLSPVGDPRLGLFEKVKPAPREGRAIDDSSRFCYDFLKAILLCVDGGPAAVHDGFRRPPEQSNESERFPLDGLEDPTAAEQTQALLTYLEALADEDKPVIDLDTNRFQTDASRCLFESQKHAVQAFSRFLINLQLPAEEQQPDTEKARKHKWSRFMAQNKTAACRFWGVKVGRALLMDAGEGVNYAFVNRAFGGLRVHTSEEIEHERSQENVDPDDEDEEVDAVDLVNALEVEMATAGSPLGSRQPTVEPDDGSDDVEMTTAPTSVVVEADAEEEDDNDVEGSEPDHGESEEDDDDDISPDDAASFHPLFRRRGAAFGRSRERAQVNTQVPYSTHSRVYKGHCNTKTVKDVNFYGLNDEYVISGSDSGHFFIWDRKTTEVVNILEGDGEVVNVVQGHPYEPMIAVSGIDSTVKIFGASARERENAENGIDIANPGGGHHNHSSLRMGGRRRRGQALEEDDTEGNRADNGLPSRKAMHQSYEIMSQNDVERRNGVGDAFLTVSADELFARAWIMSWR